MYTQCPDCKTKFLINDDQLRAAHGQVRCSRCHKVFNALESLQTPPQGASAPGSEQKPKAIPDAVTDFMSEADLEEFAELKAKITSEIMPHDKERTGTAVTDQEQGIDDDLSDVLRELERFENSSRDQTRHRDATATSEAPLLATPAEEIHEITQLITPESGDERKNGRHDPLELLNKTRPKKKKGGLLWSLGILILLAGALAQLAWFGRDKLMHYPEGRMLLETACKYAGCTLPALRAPEKIQVLSRSITVHPKIENALLIQLTIANKASFPQPHPLLQISLFSSDEMLMMQRRFKPSEYLGDDNKTGLLDPGKAMYVELAIEDPGNDVTGFKLDFF